MTGSDARRVLVVAPHPDDEVIGCGGSIRKHADRGDHVTVLTVIERGRSVLDEAVSDAELSAEVDAAHAVLGVSRRIDLDERERGVSLTRELLLRVVGAIRRVSPHVVYVPHEGEADLEHRLVHQLATEALWMAQSPFFRDCGPSVAAPDLVLGYEVWTPLSSYQYVEVIDDYLAAKVAAIRCYESQLKLSPWDKAIEGLAQYRAAHAGRGTAAEVFAVILLRRPTVSGST